MNLEGISATLMSSCDDMSSFQIHETFWTNSKAQFTSTYASKANHTTNDNCRKSITTMRAAIVKQYYTGQSLNPRACCWKIPAGKVRKPPLHHTGEGPAAAAQAGTPEPRPRRPQLQVKKEQEVTTEARAVRTPYQENGRLTGTALALAVTGLSGDPCRGGTRDEGTREHRGSIPPRQG